MTHAAINQSLLYNQSAEAISASLRHGNIPHFEEMSQRWRAVSNTASNLTAQDLNLRPPVLEANALQLLDQLITLNIAFL